MANDTTLSHTSSNSIVEHEHFLLVQRLRKPGKDILASLTPEKCELLHFAVGIASDAGEVADALKKHCIYGGDLNLEHVIEELGDVEWFCQAIRQLIGVNRTDILHANIDKLNKRYPAANYTDAHAAERLDKKA